MHPYRKERIASVIRHIAAEAIVHRLHDPRLEPLTTVTRVELTPDLLVATVFVTVPGGQACERKTLAALTSATGFVQRLVADGLQIRHCPEVRFQHDVGATLAQRTLELLDSNRRNQPELFTDEAAIKPQDGRGSSNDDEENAE
jgi:ribosome-binding factor A